MRLAIDNGNGCTCDHCHTALYPDEAIKLQAKVYHNDEPLKPYRGQYITQSKCDLCIDCYNALIGYVMHDPETERRRKRR